MAENQYRIVRDSYAGYEVQIKRWWFPVWMQPRVNTHCSEKAAEEWARHHARGCVKFLGSMKDTTP